MIPRELIPVLLLCVAILPCGAHLGEEHPPGRHDYFPDSPTSSLGSTVYLRDVLNVHGARDLGQIPDGSGRFLTVRGANHEKITQPGQVHERLYVADGPLAIEGTEGAVSVELDPQFATAAGTPGYGKFYTVSVEKEPSQPADFDSTHPARHAFDCHRMEHKRYHDAAIRWLASRVNAIRGGERISQCE